MTQVKVYTSAQSLINCYNSRAYGHGRPKKTHEIDDLLLMMLLIMINDDVYLFMILLWLFGA
jgi:hypothetical protein